MSYEDVRGLLCPYCHVPIRLYPSAFLNGQCQKCERWYHVKLIEGKHPAGKGVWRGGLSPDDPRRVQSI